MYACVHAFMHAYMHVCMHACMYVWMHVCMLCTYCIGTWTFGNLGNHSCGLVVLALCGCFLFCATFYKTIQ